MISNFFIIYYFLHSFYSWNGFPFFTSLFSRNCDLLF